MTAPLSLRLRFALLATLLGFVLSALAAVALAWASEDSEYLIANEVLRGQAEDYGLRLANGLPAWLPKTQRLSGYRLGDADLPAAYARFPPGVHEDPANADIHVGVFDTAAGRLVFTANLGDIEAMERSLHLLIAATVVLGTLLSGWIGWVLSAVAIRPLHALADAVDALPDQPQATRLSLGMQRDELRRLASAIDRYQARLVDADAREQAFLADASHELRTPLANIQGVTEVMLDDPSGRPADAARLQRLQRGVHEMGGLLEAMLATARRKALHAEPTDLAGLLGDAAALALAGQPGVGSVVQAEGNAVLPRREALLLLAGLSRRLVRGRQGAVLHLGAEAGVIRLNVASSDGDAAAPPGIARADTGTGSAFLDRLVARMGWRLLADGTDAVRIETDPSN